MDPEKSQILKYFTYSHLPTKELREVSKLFHDLAYTIEDILPRGSEKTVALRRLLEAKDGAVRAALEEV